MNKPKIIIIVRDGVLTDVRVPAGVELEVEALQIDSCHPGYEKLKGYEDKVYENAAMYSADITNMD